MISFSKNWRTLALGLMLTPLFAQTAQAQHVIVTWSTKTYPGIRCLRITSQPLSGKGYPGTKAYGVNPANGNLKTGFSVGLNNMVQISLYTIPNCAERADPKMKTKQFKLPDAAFRNDIVIGAKYVYVYML